MNKIDKVIVGLECHFDPVCGCDACPYASDGDDCYWLDLKSDAISLIREQQDENVKLRFLVQEHEKLIDGLIGRPNNEQA